MARALDFGREGRDWPYRGASRFVAAAGLTWHVQIVGAGPTLLLIHGTGASTHSWRGIVAHLEDRFRLVLIDLPGHGFTQRPPGGLFTLPGMAGGVASLLKTLDVAPDAIIGHSAGAAIMLRMALDGRVAPRALVSVNGALKPYGGNAARLFSPLAKLMFLNPLVPRLFAWQAGEDSVSRLIRNTGSDIDDEGVAFYRTLVSNPEHVSAALGMMANWDLAPLARDLPRLATPLLLVAGRGDRAIKAEDVFDVRALVPGAEVELLHGLGHLAHEERPAVVAALIRAFVERHFVA